MAVFALTDAEILAGPLRLTGRSNEITATAEAAVLDVTNFDSGGWREHIAGLATSMVMARGQLDTSPIETGAATFDAQLFTELGGPQLPLTVAPFKTDGGVAYVVGYRRGTLKMFDAVGEVAPWESEMRGDGLLGRGALIHPANVLRTGNGTGTAIVLGTVAEGQSLLVSIHVVAISGTSPELDITVERDDNAGFSSATTVVNTGAISAPTSSLTVAAGPITPDDRVRCTWTLTGTDPSARFGVAAALTPAP